MTARPDPLLVSVMLDRVADAKDRALYHRSIERQHREAAEHWERMTEWRQQDARRVAGVTP